MDLHIQISNAIVDHLYSVMQYRKMSLQHWLELLGHFNIYSIQPNHLHTHPGITQPNKQMRTSYIFFQYIDLELIGILWQEIQFQISCLVAGKKCSPLLYFRDFELAGTWTRASNTMLINLTEKPPLPFSPKPTLNPTWEVYFSLGICLVLPQKYSI